MPMLSQDSELNHTFSGDMECYHADLRDVRVQPEATDPLPNDGNDMRTRRVSFYQDVQAGICSLPLPTSADDAYDAYMRTFDTTITTSTGDQTSTTRHQDINMPENSDTTCTASFSYDPRRYTHTQNQTPASAMECSFRGDTCGESQSFSAFSIPREFAQSAFSDTTDLSHFTYDKVDDVFKSKPKKKRTTKKRTMMVKKKASNVFKQKSSSSSSTKHQDEPVKLYVQHDYHDYSRTSYEQYKKCHPGLKPLRLMKHATPFPRALHEILEEASRAGNEDIVSWCTHGRAFRIHDKNAFIGKILPRHFRQSKFTSFQRQLNIYSFRRLTKGPDRDAYYHELFLRGRNDLCRAMHRHKIKGTHHKAANNPDDEPNFYDLPFVDSSTVVDDATSICTEEEMGSDTAYMYDTANADTTVAGAHTCTDRPKRATSDPCLRRTSCRKTPTFWHSTSAIVTPTSPPSKQRRPDDAVSKLESMLLNESDASAGKISLPCHIDSGMAPEIIETAGEATCAKRVSSYEDEAYDLTLPFNTKDLERDLLQPPFIEDIPSELTIAAEEEQVGEMETFENFEW